MHTTFDSPESNVRELDKKPHLLVLWVEQMRLEAPVRGAFLRFSFIVVFKLEVHSG